MDLQTGRSNGSGASAKLAGNVTTRTKHDASAPPADLIPSLQRLGFTDYEAKAYVALSSRYPATAYEVAKVSGLPRANVYSVLRTLELKGAIQPADLKTRIAAFLPGGTGWSAPIRHDPVHHAV